MSTVLGFPDATSPTPATGKLWLTEGTGSTRDKKVDASVLVTDLLGAGINGQAAPGSALDGTELVPLYKGAGGVKATAAALDLAVFPKSVESLSTLAAIDGTEYAVVRTGTNTAKRVLLPALFQHAVADKTTTTLVKYNNGSDSLLSVDGGASDSIQIMSDPTYRFAHVHAVLNLAGKSSSSSNSNPAEILLDLDGEFPAAVFASLGTRGVAHASVGTAPLYKSYGVVAVRDSGSPPALYYRIKIYDMATGAAVPWSTLAPTNGTGVSLDIDIFGTKIP